MINVIWIVAGRRRIFSRKAANDSRKILKPGCFVTEFRVWITLVLAKQCSLVFASELSHRSSWSQMMALKPVVLLVAHSLSYFGTLLSGIILGHSSATNRSLTYVAWILFGTALVVQIVLAGIHAGCHLRGTSRQTKLREIASNDVPTCSNPLLTSAESVQRVASL